MVRVPEYLLVFKRARVLPECFSHFYLFFMYSNIFGKKNPSDSDKTPQVVC